MKEIDVSCLCAKCAAACRHIPGVFHPLEALRALRAGYAVDLMAVAVRPWKVRGRAYEDYFEALYPRSINPVVGSGVDPHWRKDSFDAKGRCVFFTRLDRCAIHASGFKPVECRLEYICAGKDAMTDAERLSPWQTRVGEIIVKLWRAELKNPAPAARRRVEARRASL